MKSDSKRQTEYQHRRLQRQARVTFWLPRAERQLMERLMSSGETQTDFLRTAVSELIIRRLLDIPFSDTIAEGEVQHARVVAEEKFGISLAQ